MSSKVLDLDTIDCVMYHGHCFDGFGSAFIVWMYYKEKFGLKSAEKIVYKPCNYNDTNSTDEKIEEFVRGKNILMCDFSYDYNRMCKLIESSNSFMVLDHHKTAESCLKKIPDNLKIFDMERSGVGITWDFFFRSRPLPRFLSYIQDRDLWTFKIEETNEFITFFYEQPHDFNIWLEYLDEGKVEEALQKGRHWREYQDMLIERVSRRANCVIQNIDGNYQIVAYVNNSDLKSDIGNKIFKFFPYADFACIWDYHLHKNSVSISLRSTDDRTDVSKIASKFSGGGHRNAAGCTLENFKGNLPFPTVRNHGFINALRNATRGHFGQDTNDKNKYLLLSIDKLPPPWIEVEFMDLIKHKAQDCSYIVFAIGSKDKGSINYNIMFNDKAPMDAENRLLMFGGIDKDRVLSFVSDRDFKELALTIKLEQVNTD